MSSIIISNLPPAPPLTGSAIPKGTDLVPATDITAITTSTPTGVTNKYTQASILNFYLMAMGYTTYAAVRVATTSALTAVYNNGTIGVGATLTNSGAMVALSIDGVALALGDRVIVQTQASTFQNGIYTVSAIGSASVNWVLTRATDYDQTSEIVELGLTLVNQGLTYAGKLFEEIAPTPITVGTSPILFALYSMTTPQSFGWNEVTGTTAPMLSNQGYVSNNPSQVALQLPISSMFGDEIAVSGKGAGGWIIDCGAGQSVAIGSVSTTSGGSVASTNYTDSVRLVCIVPNLQWTTTGSPQGSLSLS